MGGSLLTSGHEPVGWLAMFASCNAHGVLTSVGFAMLRLVCIAHEATGKWEDAHFVFV